jgi:8-oxo-dGTP diphosphatase
MKHMVLPAVNVFIIDGNKILLGRRANTGWMDGFLCAPGGHIEQGETPSIAMLREIKEELGAGVKLEDIEFLCVAARNASPMEYASYEFVIRDKNYEFINAEPDKCSELVWVEVDNLPDDIVDDFRLIIQRSLIGKESFLELGY